MNGQRVSVLLVSLAIWSSSSAAMFGVGSCPRTPSFQNFDLSRYLGRWYEYARSFAIFELGLKCVTAEYGLQENGAVSVTNRGVNSLLGTPSNIRGEATIPNLTDPSRLLVVFPTPIPMPPANYQILTTDYENFAVVYSCNSFLKFFRTENLWILSRLPTLDPVSLQTATQYIQQLGLDRISLDRTSQTNCS